MFHSFYKGKRHVLAFCSVYSTNRNMTGTKTVITHKSSLSNLNGYNTSLPLSRLKTTSDITRFSRSWCWKWKRGLECLLCLGSKPFIYITVLDCQWLLNEVRWNEREHVLSWVKVSKLCTLQVQVLNSTFDIFN